MRTYQVHKMCGLQRCVVIETKGEPVMATVVEDGHITIEEAAPVIVEQPTFDPQNVIRWVEALSHYSQCSGALRKFDSFCCLGVGGDLFIETTHLAYWIGERDLIYLHMDRSYHEYLPDQAQAWLGLTSTGVEQLVDWNDSRSYTFAQIAELIKQTPWLFTVRAQEALHNLDWFEDPSVT